MTLTKNSRNEVFQHGVQTISRNLILEGLGSLKYEDDINLGSPLVRDCQDAVPPDALDSLGFASTLDGDDAVLHETRVWLDELAQGEHSRVDWSSEHHLERIARPLNRISKHDRAKLDRISQGQGPRERTFEDILGPLRLTPTLKPVGNSSFEETYEEQLEVLWEWNQQVGSIPSLDTERDELYEILEERCHLMTQVELGHRSPTDIDTQSSRLRKALRRFRPEVAHFENRSSLHILVVIVAHFRVANPDIDLELKDKMIETIFREVRLLMRAEEQHDVRDDLLQTRLRAAHEAGDNSVADCLRKEIRDLAKEDRKRCTERTVDRIKAARRQVQAHKLAELQNLALPQVGMKWAAYDKLPVPYDLLRDSLENKAAARRLQELLATAEAACDADLANVGNMLSMAYGCHERTRRFAARDVPSRERERAVLTRMDDPRKYSMMMRVVDDRRVLSRIPEVVVEHMTMLDGSLRAALDVAKERYRELDGWERALLDEDIDIDLGLALVGKLMLEANSAEAGRRFGYRKKDKAEEEEGGVCDKVYQWYPNEL